MSTDNCPHCGSAQSDAPNQRHISWDCKTWRRLDGCVIRSCVCIERENGNLRAENAELRERLAEEESDHLNALAVCYAVGEFLADRITKDELEETYKINEESEGE